MIFRQGNKGHTLFSTSLLFHHVHSAMVPLQCHQRTACMVESYQIRWVYSRISPCVQLSIETKKPGGKGQTRTDAGTTIPPRENLFHAHSPWFYSHLLDIGSNFSRLSHQLPRVSQNMRTKSSPRLRLPSPKGHAKYQVLMRLASQRYRYRVCLITSPNKPRIAVQRVPYLHSRCLRLHRLTVCFDYQ